jgi:O-antigen/teichoic acid export membrane protein
VTAVLVGSVVLNIAINFAAVRYLVPWMTFGWRYWDMTILRQLVRPSLGQFLIYISANIAAIQLPRIVLGHLVGPTVVAGFTVAVTYTRAARIFTLLFSQSLQVETARAFAEKRRDALTRMIEGLCQVHLWSSFSLVLGLVLLGGPLFAIWTHHKIAFDFELCVILGMGSIVGAYSDVITTVLVGINRIWPIAIGHFIATLSAIGLAAILIPSFGVASMALALLLPEIVAAAVGIATLIPLLDLSGQQFIVGSMKMPFRLLGNEIGRVFKNKEKFVKETPKIVS